MDVLQTQATVTTPPATRVDPASSFDAWLLQKLRVEWSSREFGALLTPSKLAEARASFPHLETPIKVRLLLSLLSVRRDEAEAAAGKKEVDALLQLADNDAEEWVKVSAGIVKQFLVLQADGQPADSYLHAQLEATASKVVQTVAVPPQRRGNSSLVALDDFYSLENGLLNPSLRPQLVPTAATHFTVSGEDDDVNGKEDELGASPVKKPLHRPQMARPSAGMAASTATASAASTRLVQTVPKPPIGKKKNMTELSSEIRRKADAGRFKRQRSRISMIDINEVKQIESDKAQKAEERKKQKLAAKEKEKEKAKEKEKEKNAAAAVDASVNAAENAGSTDGATVPVVVNEEHAAIAADIFAMHHQPGPDEGMQQYSQQQPLQTEVNTETTDVNQAADEDEYVPDGTQALLNAAFHSTQDIMKEVVSQQSHQIQDQQIQQQQLQQPAYQDLYRTQQQMQMHHLAPPQQQYHQGFEPEDASLNNTNTGGMPMGFGGFNYGTTAGYYGDQFGNYGAPQDTNAFGSGYSNSAMQQDNNMGLPQKMDTGEKSVSFSEEDEVVEIAPRARIQFKGKKTIKNRIEFGNAKIHRTQRSIKMKPSSPIKKLSPTKGKIIRLKSDEILARGSESASVHSRLGTTNTSKTMSKLAHRIGKVSLSPQSSRNIMKKTGNSVFDRLGGNRSF